MCFIELVLLFLLICKGTKKINHTTCRFIIDLILVFFLNSTFKNTLDLTVDSWMQPCFLFFVCFAMNEEQPGTGEKALKDSQMPVHEKTS